MNAGVETDRDLEAMLDGYRRRGFALALQLLGDADDAADAVQDGLGKLWANRRAIQRGRDPTAWFFRVLRNVCIDRMRRRPRRRHAALDVEPVDRKTATPLEQAESSEFRERLAGELGNLTPAYREIILLRDFQDLSYAQIAEVLGISQGTVMSRLHRARMILRDRLKEWL